MTVDLLMMDYSGGFPLLILSFLCLTINLKLVFYKLWVIIDFSIRSGICLEIGLST